jgi:signal transduction histidine kinase
MDSSLLHTHHYAESMLTHMPVGVALFDAQNFCLLSINNLYENFLDTFLEPEWRHGRALGHPLTEWVPDAEATGVADIFRAVVTTGKPYRGGEYAFPAFSCGMTYWNWTIDPIYDDTGQIVQLLLTANNITPQVVARQQIEQHHSTLNQAHTHIVAEHKRLEVIETVARSVQTSLDTESISRATIDAVVTHFSPAYVYIHTADTAKQELKLLHIHPPLKIQKYIALAQHIPFDSMYPVAQAHQQKELIIIEDIHKAAQFDTRFEPFLALNSHSYICVPLWFRDHFEGALTAIFSEPMLPDAPQVRTLIGCSTHIAVAFAHARLHAAAEHERSRLYSILQQLPEGVLIVEASSGAISYANDTAASILGIPISHLVDLPLHQYQYFQSSADYFAQEQSSLPWTSAIARALGGETTSSQEMMVVKPDGAPIVTLSSSAPLRSETGSITGAVIVFQDVTFQKSLEQQKNEFLSIASHELRTPITAIQGFAEILQMQAERGRHFSPQSQRALNIIIEQSQCLTRLIEEMLDVTRIENMRLRLNIKEHDFLKTLTHVLDTQSGTTMQHSIRPVLEGPGATDTLPMYYDEDRVVQIFNNLISNAIKYSAAGSPIEIGLRYARQTDREVVCWVKDQGIGISANELPHIFKRFHRASTIDRSISGLGLGLYLVKELVTLHQGEVWAESIEGQGSTFFVRLPLHPVEK